MVANAPEMIVLMQASPITPASPSAEMLACDPALKAKNPKKRMKPPKAASYNANKNILLIEFCVSSLNSCEKLLDTPKFIYIYLDLFSVTIS